MGGCRFRMDWVVRVGADVGPGSILRLRQGGNESDPHHGDSLGDPICQRNPRKPPQGFDEALPRMVFPLL